MSLLSRPILFAHLFALTASPVIAGPIQLSPPAPAGLGVTRVDSSPDAQWVHYVAQYSGGSCASLYRVHRSGGSSERLSGPPVAECDVRVETYSADGERVVFSIQTPSGAELWSAPVGGTEAQAVRLDPSSASFPEIEGAVAFGDLVLFLAANVGGAELYLVPAAGPASSARRLDSQGVGWWQPVPGADKVVYTDGPELYSVGTALGALPVRLDASIPGGQGVAGFRVSEDDFFVLYLAEQVQAGRADLFRIPIGGPAGSAVQLNGSLPMGHIIGSHPSYYRFDPTGTRVVFETFRNGQRGGVFSVLATGVPASQVRLDTAPNETLALPRLTPDGQYVLFLGEQENADRIDVYRVPSAGPAGAAERLNVPTDAVVNYWLTESGDTVVYLTDGGDWTGGSDPREYHRVPVLGGSAPVVISGLGGQAVDAAGFASEVGGHWVYTGQVGSGPSHELFSVSLEGSPPTSQVRLNSSPDFASVLSFEPLGERWVAFRDRPNATGQLVGMAAPVDGSSATFQLHPLLPPWFETDEVEVMEDGQSVLYTIYAEETSPVGKTLYLNRIPEIFVDGFESGSVEGWSGSVGGG